MSGPVFCACLKPVELRARADPLSGEVVPDPISLGFSPSDEAALEWALCSAEAYGGHVRAVACGGPRGDDLLRRAGAVGARELVRVEAPGDWPSEQVASALAPEVSDASLVWCGDMSTDRGSGAVPAFLAAELSFPQALGLVEVELAPRGADKGGEESERPSARPRLTALRRLDGGRRERLAVEGPAVLSCEGGTARLRRAGLRALVEARPMEVALRVAPLLGRSFPALSGVAPFRPPARVVAPPPGETPRERIGALSGALAERRSSRLLRLSPREAARAIVEALEDWGEL